jgi:hypothetical protein
MSEKPPRQPRRPRPAARAGLLLVGSTGASWVLLGATEGLRRPASHTYADLLAALAAWLLVGCAGWWLSICAAATLESLSSGRLRATSWVGCPSFARRLLLAGLGVALVGAGPAHADATATLPVPARPLGGPAEGPVALVVRPGDTLWQLASDRLGPRAPAGEVAALVERLHHRNRHRIGPDPDLIQPGQRLVVPPVDHPGIDHPGIDHQEENR